MIVKVHEYGQSIFHLGMMQPEIASILGMPHRVRSTWSRRLSAISSSGYLAAAAAVSFINFR
jgi:hypothetical protein